MVNEETQSNFKSILKKHIASGVSISNISKQLGYSSPSILSMILSGKRQASSQIILKAFTNLEIPLVEKLKLIDKNNVKNQVLYLDPPFSGLERREFFSYLNNQKPKKVSITQIQKYKRVKQAIEKHPTCSYQDATNFPYFFQVKLTEDKVKSFEQEFSELLELLITKYNTPDLGSTKLLQGSIQMSTKSTVS